MAITITLDWLAFTFKEDTHEAAAWIHLYASSKMSVPVSPTNGYRQAYASAQGVVVMWNLNRAEMGYHVIISGSALRHVLEHYELDQRALVQTVLDACGSITRLDLAKDLRGEKVSLDSIYQSMERRETTGTARSFSQIHSLNGGNTIYVGSRQSEKFIRIYDKAAQLALANEFWSRYELETKGMIARAMAEALVQESNWGACFDTMARHMVDIRGSVDYAKFFVEGAPEIGIPKLEKKSDREKWIIEQVMPAVVKHAIENPDSEGVRLLVRMLQQTGNW